MMSSKKKKKKYYNQNIFNKYEAPYANIWDIPRQLTPFSTFFCRPSPILLKFGMFVGLDEKMSHTKF